MHMREYDTHILIISHLDLLMTGFSSFIELMKNVDRRLLSHSVKTQLATEMSRYKRIRMKEYLLD